jgi:hypothetical protein
MITAIRLMRPTKTSHPVHGMADDLSTGIGFRFVDDPAARVIRVWHGDKYEGRVPYEACVMIYEDEATNREEDEATNRSYHPDAIRAQALGLTGEQPGRQRHGKHRGRR